MSEIRTRPVTKGYRKGWSRVYGKKSRGLKTYNPGHKGPSRKGTGKSSEAMPPWLLRPA